MKRIKKLSRRDFLNLSAGTAAGTLLAACGAQPTPETVVETVIVEKEGETVVETVVVEKEVEKVVTATSAPVEEVTLDFVSWLPEYDNAYQQIWDIFEAEHPGIKVNVSAINEDTRAAFDAKVAGGYVPAMKQLWHDEPITADNYTNFVDLNEIGFPWFDRWQWDVRNEWSNRYQKPGPRCVDPYAGIVASLVYHADIVEDKMGRDPQKEIKTLDDFREFAEEVTQFAESDPDLEFGWDRAWHNGFTYLRLMNLIPVAWSDGGRDRQTDCWMGRAKFNDPDGPYRHTFEWLNEVYTNGWNPENWWNREWEADMEATFIAKKSVMLVHGHWMWDKTLAGNPDAYLKGFPFPSVDGQKTILHMEEPFVSSGWTMFAEAQEQPWWEEATTAFFWWNSPQAVLMRAQAEGRAVMYDLDEQLELQSAQYNGLIKHVGNDFFSHVVMDSGPWGEQSAAPYRQPGSPGVWDRETGGFNDTFLAAVRGEISSQEALDAAQANWDQSYPDLPLG